MCPESVDKVDGGARTGSSGETNFFCDVTHGELFSKFVFWIALEADNGTVSVTLTLDDKPDERPDVLDEKELESKHGARW